MVHIYEFNSYFLVYDSESGYVQRLDELQYTALRFVTPPLEEECPSALRYSLAKYESGEVKSAYSSIYELYREGKLFSADGRDIPSSVGTHADNEAEEIIAPDELPAFTLRLKARTRTAMRTIRTGGVLSEEDAKYFAVISRAPDGKCASCWAKKICRLRSPSPENPACAAELLRCEAALLVSTAEKK